MRIPPSIRRLLPQFLDNMDSQKLPNVVEVILPPHHRNTASWRHGRFDNPWDTWQERTFKDLLRWNRERRAAGLPTDGYLSWNKKPTREDFMAAFPAEPIDFTCLYNPPNQAIQITYVGHCSFIVQMEGIAFLTDPVWSERCSPVQFLGPKRCVPPPIDLKSLPKLDFVVISHNHYDHLDSYTVYSLHKQYGEELVWYVPIGLKAWFKSQGIKNVIEMDWWEEITHHHGTKNVQIVFTPAQHWSMRSPWTRKASLWGGWAVVSDKLRFWFTGDTGFCKVFKEIGDRLGPFDISLIPTGAYAPRWFMRPQHVSPSEAVEIFLDTKTKRGIACHCCTFPLTDEPMDEPVTLLAQEMKLKGLPEDAFITLKHGGMIQSVAGKDLKPPPVLKIPLK